MRKVFTSAPNKEHAQALILLGRYLKGNQDKGIMLIPKIGKYLEVYVDTDFAGNWDKDESLYRYISWSRHGYITIYDGLPLVWKPQLQTDITLLITDS